MQRVLWVACALLVLASKAPAEQAPPSLDRHYSLALYDPGIFSTIDSSMLMKRLPVKSFLDGTRLPSTALGRMGTESVDFANVALVSGSELQPITVAEPPPQTEGKDFVDSKQSAAALTVSQSPPLHYGGEVGFLYGHESGKSGGDLWQTYGVGTVGNDHLQITVGASYEEWNGHTSHGHH